MTLRTPSRRTGFTRLELIAVLVGVAIIVALAAPLVSSWMRVDAETTCKNNLRRQMVGMHSFLSTAHHFPMVVSPEPDKGREYPWPVVLEAVISKDVTYPPRVFAEKKLRGSIWDCPANPALTEDDQPFNYGMNGYGLIANPSQEPLGIGGKRTLLSRLEAGDTRQPVEPVRESDVVAPSWMIALGDAVSGWGEQLWDSTIFSRRPAGMTDKPSETLPMLHGRNVTDGAANTAFVDGHVELLRFKTLFSDKVDAALSRWNRDNQPHRERLE